jgi:tRNA(Ile)-lysidine synthase
MEHIAPATVRLLQRQASLLREDERYLEQLARDLYASLVRPDVSGGQRFDRHAFAVIPAALQRRIVRMLLRKADHAKRAPQARVVDDVLRFILHPTDRLRLTLRHARVLRDGDAIVVNFLERAQSIPSISAEESRLLEVPVPVPSTVYWPGTKQEIQVQVTMRQAAEQLVKHPTHDCAVFDADRVSGPLLIRGWRAGDRFYPVGMGGKSKKLQDFFMDMKIRRQERGRIPLLVAPEGILWVVGRRQDERFRVREESTRCLVAAVKSQSVRGGAE